MFSKKVVIFGPPLSGKTEIARETARVRQGYIKTFQQRGVMPGADPRGPIVFFEANGTAFELTTFAGAVWDINEWDTLLANTDGILLVVDPQNAQRKADSEYIEKLNQSFRDAWSGVVVFTKQDLVDQVSAEAVGPSSLQGTSFEHWPVFHSRIDQPKTLLNPVEFLVSQLCAEKNKH